MVALQKFAAVIAAVLMLLFWPVKAAAQVPTPEPGTVACSTVERLNVRAGPGTEHPVVNGLVYNQCSPLFEYSADEEWARVDQGWVAVRYIKLQQATAAPTAVPPTLAPPTAAPTSAAANMPESIPTAISDKQQAARPNLAETSYANLFNLPAGMFAVASFYIGLVTARKFNVLRMLANGLLLVVVLFGLVYLVSSRLILPYFSQYAEQIAAPLRGLYWIAPAIYFGSFLLGKLVYRKPSAQERGADTPCSVCGTVQRHNRLKECARCHRLYCDFPAWTNRSLRNFLDMVALWIAIPLLIILTAISILGGVLVVAILAVPYFLFRELLPESHRPPYWKTCGSSGICHNCSKRRLPSDEYWGESSSNSVYDSYAHQDETTWDTSRDDDRDDDSDDDEDGKESGSAWDGWLVKY